MKVVAFNGSPKRNGNTQHIIQMVADELVREGMEVEIIHVGLTATHGCIACNWCAKNRTEQCVFKEDAVNGWIQKMKEADGIILGSPTYYSNIAGTMKCFLDRAFYVAGVNGGLFRGKVGAAVAAVRRTGGMVVYQNLLSYFTISEMNVVSANYWNVVHGGLPGEVMQDEEGVQLSRLLGRNMAWMLKVREATRDTIPFPEAERKVYTNFIRNTRKEE